MEKPFYAFVTSLLDEYLIARQTVLALFISFFFCAQLDGQVTFIQMTSGVIVNNDVPCSSASWGDYDDDGDLDLFVGSGASFGGFGHNFLYENNGDGNFTRITTGTIVNEGLRSLFGAWGDYDRDGDLDLFVAEGEPRLDSFLYANNGNGTFTSVTSGDIVENSKVESFGASWGDYDNNGTLDLFLANRGFASNFLYKNNGNGTFMQITQGDIVNEEAGISTSGLWADYDNDGDLDLFAANSFGRSRDRNNFLYANNGDGSFTKITDGDIVNDGGHSIGGSWGDFDNDGDLDLFVTNRGTVTMEQPNFLYENSGVGTFSRITQGVVVTDRQLSVGSSWGDFDNDGDLDLFVTNDVRGTSGDDNRLYLNNRDGTFIAIANQFGKSASIGVASGDYDNDGDLDVFIANADAGNNNFFFINNGSPNHWVNISCTGLASNMPQIGTKVRIKATIDGTPVWQMREVTSQTGAHSQNSMRVHFGLGDATIIDSLKIEWLSGNVDIYVSVAADFFYKAVEGAGLNLLPTSAENTVSTLPQQFELSQNYPNPFNPTTTITFTVGTTQKMTLVIYDALGREVRTLWKGTKRAGAHEVSWDARDHQGLSVSSGIYFYKLTAGHSTQTRKMVLLR